MSDKLKKRLQEILEEQARIKRMDDEQAITTERRNQQRAEIQDNLERAKLTGNPRDPNETKESRVAQSIHEATTADVNAYNDWRSAMMFLVRLDKEQLDVLDLTRQQIISFVGSGALSLYDAAAHSHIIDKLRGTPDVVLPELHHFVGFTEDNKLEISNLKLTRADKVELSAEDQKLFNTSLETAVKDWLKTKHGYEPDKSLSGRFHKIDGTLLNKETFDILKKDSVNGLSAFLRTELDLVVQEAPEPFSPRMS